MAVSSLLKIDPSFGNHSRFFTSAFIMKPVPHRDEPISTHPSSPERGRTSPFLFCLAPENDVRRFELYDALEQVYSVVWSGRNQGASNYTHLDQKTRRWLYQTVFEILNHRTVVEDILNESGFYAKNFDLHSHEALVHVITYDFLKNKFSIRVPDSADYMDKIPHLALRVGDALRKHKLKLNATLARMRIKADARSLTELLPLDAQEKYLGALRHPHYARINMAKVSNASEVVLRLVADEFLQAHNISQLSAFNGAFFHGWKDLIAFSPDCRGKIDDHPLVRSGQLILQDRSSYHVIERLIRILDTCPMPAHVILTNPGTEVFHIASPLKDKGTVSVYGLSSVTADAFQQRATLLGLNNIQLVQSPFSALLPTDTAASTASLILCLPLSTLPTVINPVDFVLQEGGHVASSLLPAPKGAGTYCEEQTETLVHALEFVRVQYLVYVTRSVHSCENETIVRRALERHGTNQHRQVPSIAQDHEEGLQHYIAILEKVPAEPLPAPSEVIAKAIADGILSGEGLSHAEKKKKKKKKTKKVFSSSDGIPMTIAAQKKVVHKKSPEAYVRPFRH